MTLAMKSWTIFLWWVVLHDLAGIAVQTFIAQAEITSSDKTCGGPGEPYIWLINTEPTGYNNGRQVVSRFVACCTSFYCGLRGQFAFTVESADVFEEWDSFLEGRIEQAKQNIRNLSALEQSKVREDAIEFARERYKDRCPHGRKWPSGSNGTTFGSTSMSSSS